MTGRWYLEAKAEALLPLESRKLFAGEIQLKSFVRRNGVQGIPKQTIQILKVDASHRHW